MASSRIVHREIFGPSLQALRTPATFDAGQADALHQLRLNAPPIRSGGVERR